MKYFKYIVLTSVLFTTTVMAQQDPNRTFYRYYMNLVNPAYAGTSETTDIGVNFRSQWVDVQGAPETQSFFFSKAAGKNVGLGMSIINDKTFIESQTNLNLDFSYHIKINDKTSLYLGLKAGLNSYNANTRGLQTFGGFGGVVADPSVNDFEGGFKPNVGAGGLLKGEKFFVSLSSPNLVTTERLEQQNGIARLGSSRTHYYLGIGYDFTISNTIVFKPSTLVRYVNATPLSIDAVATFSFNERIELGPSYRLNEGLGGLLIFNADKWIALGYAYQAAFESQVQGVNDGTHEVSIIFKL